MNIYYAVVPKLQNEDGSPITDLNKMTAQAIVAMIHNETHIYTLDETPWGPLDIDESYLELQKILAYVREAREGEDNSLFKDMVAHRIYHFHGEVEMIDTFFHNMKLYRDVSLHSWNTSFDIQCLKTTSDSLNYDLQKAMGAALSDLFSRTDDLNKLNILTRREIPVKIDGLSYVDGVTKYGMPLNDHRLGGLSISNIFSSIAGMKYVPYWYTAKSCIAGLEEHVDMFKDKPHCLMAEELFALYQNRFIVETVNNINLNEKVGVR